jgi:hypothetical protein
MSLPRPSNRQPRRVTMSGTSANGARVPRSSTRSYRCRAPSVMGQEGGPGGSSPPTPMHRVRDLSPVRSPIQAAHTLHHTVKVSSEALSHMRPRSLRVSLQPAARTVSSAAPSASETKAGMKAFDNLTPAQKMKLAVFNPPPCKECYRRFSHAPQCSVPHCDQCGSEPKDCWCSSPESDAQACGCSECEKWLDS